MLYLVSIYIVDATNLIIVQIRKWLYLVSICIVDATPACGGGFISVGFGINMHSRCNDPFYCWFFMEVIFGINIHSRCDIVLKKIFYNIKNNKDDIN
jgi:hypothetical protein